MRDQPKVVGLVVPASGGLQITDFDKQMAKSISMRQVRFPARFPSICCEAESRPIPGSARDGRPATFTCTACGGAWMLEDHPAVKAQRAREGLHAFSRFLVFVVAEAYAAFYASGGVPIEHEREHQVARMLRSGALRVKWGSP